MNKRRGFNFNILYISRATLEFAVAAKIWVKKAQKLRPSKEWSKNLIKMNIVQMSPSD